MLFPIVCVLMVGTLLLLVFASMQPPTFRVERSQTINAEAVNIFPLVNDFHQWAKWSPFEHLDPKMKKTFSGSAQGFGAIYEWEGNFRAGQGRAEIVASTEPTAIELNLIFIKPFKGQNHCKFSFENQGRTTVLSWSMTGKNTFISKIMSTFFDQDIMLGSMFESGLRNINDYSKTRT